MTSNACHIAANHERGTIQRPTGDTSRPTDMRYVMNAANAELRIGGGVADALHRAIGRGLERECEPLAPIALGEAVIAAAHGLPNTHVVHRLEPVYGIDEPTEDQLSRPVLGARRNVPKTTASRPSPFRPSRPVRSATHSSPRRTSPYAPWPRRPTS